MIQRSSLQREINSSGQQELPTLSVERCLHLALPLVSLYQPAGSWISKVAGTGKALSSFSSLFSSSSPKIIEESLSIFSFVSSFFNFKPALFLSTSVEILQRGSRTLTALGEQDYDKACKEFLHTLSSGGQLALLSYSSSLEMRLASALLNTVVSLYQTYKECDKEVSHTPEIIVQAILTAAKAHQTYQTYQTIQARTELLALQKQLSLFLQTPPPQKLNLPATALKRVNMLQMNATSGEVTSTPLDRLRARLEKGKDVAHLAAHPLKNFSELIDQKKVIMEDGEGNKYDFGAHFHGYGKGLVKGMNLTWKKKVVEGQEVTELDFKINHVFREKLGKLMEELKQLNPKDVQTVLASSGSSLTGLSISETGFKLGAIEVGNGVKMSFQDIGTLYIGNDKPSIKNRLIVHLNKGKEFEHLHSLLSFLDLEDTLKISTEDDIKRLKLGHLFHTLWPREAFTLERDEKFFSLPFDQLKEAIFKSVPEMQQVAEKYIEEMSPFEILPGRIRYRIPGLAQKAQQLGATAFTAKITGAENIEQDFNRITSILKMGMLASELRISSGINTDGLKSNLIDFNYNSADSVFVQMLVNTGIQPYPYGYPQSARLIFSLELFETGTYQYYHDSCGRRLLGFHYPCRPSIIKLITQEKQNTMFIENEVMIKERIPPSMIKAVLVKNMETHKALLDHLREKNLIQLNDKKQETILGIPVDKFIRVGSMITTDMVDVA